MTPTYRQLHTKTLDSYDFNEMPDDFTRVVWLLLPLISDSEGRGIYNPTWIKSKMFPIRSDVNSDQLQKCFEWFSEREMIKIYKVQGREYYYISKWKHYQRGTEKEAKSLLPCPPELVKSYSGVDQELVGVAESVNESFKSFKSFKSLNVLNESFNGFNSMIEEEASKTLEWSDKTFAQIGKVDYVKIWSLVTGQAMFPGSKADEVMNAMNALSEKYVTPGSMVDYLKPYFEKWITTRTRSGLPYKKNNIAWLIDFAVTGVMPGTDEKEFSF